MEEMPGAQFTEAGRRKNYIKVQYNISPSASIHGPSQMYPEAHRHGCATSRIPRLERCRHFSITLTYGALGNLWTPATQPVLGPRGLSRDVNNVWLARSWDGIHLWPKVDTFSALCYKIVTSMNLSLMRGRIPESSPSRPRLGRTARSAHTSHRHTGWLPTQSIYSRSPVGCDWNSGRFVCSHTTYATSCQSVIGHQTFTSRFTDRNQLTALPKQSRQRGSRLVFDSIKFSSKPGLVSQKEFDHRCCLPSN